MNNLEFIKSFDVDKTIHFFREFIQYKCMFCKYHYDKDDCFNKNCDEGMKEWLEQKVDNNLWESFDTYIERVEETKKELKKRKADI